MKTEFNFNDVVDRVKKALKINADYELAERINMKPTTFNSRKKANSLPYEEILALANSEKLDFNWLLTGEGEMLRETPAHLHPVASTPRRTHSTGMSEQRLAAMAGLMDALNEDQQREILAVIAEKKTTQRDEKPARTTQFQLASPATPHCLMNKKRG